MTNTNQQGGFVLLGVLALCTALTLAGIYAARSVQLATDAEAISLIRNQAFNAAHSSLQWGAQYAEINSTCPGSVEPLTANKITSEIDLTLSKDFFNRFENRLYCQRTRHIDNGIIYVFWFRSVVEFGSPGQPHFVSRELESLHVF